MNDCLCLYLLILILRMETEVEKTLYAGDSISNTHDVLYLEDFVVLDVETTGTDVSKNKIVQLAMIKVKTNGEVETLNRYFNPCMSRDSQIGAYHIHKISPDNLLKMKPFKHYHSDVMEFIKEAKYLVGHNVLFDWNYLYKELSATGCYSDDDFLDFVLVDTYKCSISAFPKMAKYTLESLGQYLKIETFRQPTTHYGLKSPKKNKKEVIKIVEPEESSYHDALTDSMVTKELLEACLEQIQSDKKCEKYSLLDLEVNKKQFVYPLKCVFLTDKLLNNSITNSEKTELYEFAKTYMCPLPRCRGKQLTQMTKLELFNSIQYLDSFKNKNLNDKRFRGLMDLICQGKPVSTDLDEECSSTSSNKRESTIVEYFPQKKLRLSEKSSTNFDKSAPIQSNHFSKTVPTTS